VNLQSNLLHTLEDLLALISRSCFTCPAFLLLQQNKVPEATKKRLKNRESKDKKKKSKALKNARAAAAAFVAAAAAAPEVGSGGPWIAVSTCQSYAHKHRPYQTTRVSDLLSNRHNAGYRPAFQHQ
jgi:hypothetical protein